MAGTDTPDVGAPHSNQPPPAKSQATRSPTREWRNSAPVRPSRRVLPPDPATAPDDGGWTGLGRSRHPAERRRRLEWMLWLLVAAVAVAGLAVIGAILTTGPSTETILPSDAPAADVPLAQPTGPIAPASPGTEGGPDDRHEARDGPLDDGPGASDDVPGGGARDDAAGGGASDAHGDAPTDAADVGVADGHGRIGGSLRDDAAAPDGLPGSGGGVDDSPPDGEPGADDGGNGTSGADDGAGGDTSDDGASDSTPPSPTDGGVPAGWSEVARGFGLAFTRTSVGRDAWFATMSSWLTPQQAAEYRDVPIESIPIGELVEIDVADPGSEAHTHGTLTYDTGMVLEVGLSYRDAAGGWLVARVELAGAA